MNCAAIKAMEGEHMKRIPENSSSYIFLLLTKMLWYSWILFLGLLFHSSFNVKAEGQEAEVANAAQSAQATDRWGRGFWGGGRFFGRGGFYGPWGFGAYGYPYGGWGYPYGGFGYPYVGGWGLGGACTINAFGRTICVV